MLTLPRILISGSDGDRSSYERAVRRAGGEPHSAYCPPVDLSWDGLILAGGGDIAPARFGQEDRGSQPPDLLRDRAELDLAEAFLAAGKPILGICRGHQVLNVALGGTLIQDLPPEVRPFHAHEEGEDDRIHPVRSRPGSLLRQLYGPLFSVNSYHHQGLDALGGGLIPTAWSEWGVVEGAEHVRLPVFSVQFHPERMTGDLARRDTVDGGTIFRCFLALCGGGPG